MFGYHDDIVTRFPGVRAGIVHVIEVDAATSPPSLHDEYVSEQQQVAVRLEDLAIAEIPSIAAWRRVFADFGVKPTQYRNAAESLLRRLSKRGDVPSINPLVDIGNLVSIRHALPVAVIDRAGVDGPIEVRFAAGDEPFEDLGSEEISHPEPGEVVFVDEAGSACARRWCWRQSAPSASSPSTAEAMFVIEGHHDSAETDVRSAAEDVVALVDRHLPHGGVSIHELSPATRRVVG
jgi:DNA/RNA-binding domain of Phe-tRNA-synthetase-like protein